MSTPVIYEMDSIGVNGALEAVGTHPFCSTSCRDTHIWKMLGPVKTGESDMDVSGLLCEECGKPLYEKTFAGIIDITPVGCQTPEGNARVAAAMREFENATAEVANLATAWIKGHAFNVLPEGMDDLHDIREAITERESKQEAFLRAVAGR